MRLVEEANPSQVWPETVKAVVEAACREVLPVTNNVPMVPTVEEALLSQVWPETVKAEVEALPSWLETNREPVTVDWIIPPALREKMVVEPLLATVSNPTLEVEATVNKVIGLLVPMPTLPADVTVRYWALEEEATVKIGKVGFVEEPSTTKLAVGVVELIPIS